MWCLRSRAWSGSDRKLERKLLLVHTGSYAAAVTLLAAPALLWYGAFSRSEARIEDTGSPPRR